MSASPVEGGFRPRRVAAIVAGIVVAALAIDYAFPHAGFVDGVALVFATALAVLGTVRGIGLWRGTVSHTTITYAPALMGMSLERVQAATPCAIVAFDGALLMFAILVLTGATGPLARPLAFAGAAIFVVFTCAWICVGALLRPRFLLPATMRPR